MDRLCAMMNSKSTNVWVQILKSKVNRTFRDLMISRRRIQINHRIVSGLHIKTTSS